MVLYDDQAKQEDLDKRLVRQFEGGGDTASDYGAGSEGMMTIDDSSFHLKELEVGCLGQQVSCCTREPRGSFGPSWFECACSKPTLAREQFIDDFRCRLLRLKYFSFFRKLLISNYDWSCKT
jgi:hypothetical protein